MGFLLYLIGSVVFIAGMAWVATLAGISQTLVAGGALALLAIAIILAVTRERDGDLA
jgi:hypothetical protein